jgi:assimilatory nitrate reductase catalytic subunit
MELKALVVPTIRPDTLFIPFHYGHRQAVNQLTNPAVEPTVKIPEYKVSAATVERLDQPERSATDRAPLEHFTALNAPRMFPYAVGETKTRSPMEGKHG